MSTQLHRRSRSARSLSRHRSVASSPSDGSDDAADVPAVAAVPAVRRLPLARGSPRVAHCDAVFYSSSARCHERATVPVLDNSFACIEWTFGRSVAGNMAYECEIRLDYDTEILYFQAFFRPTGVANRPAARVLGGTQWPGDIVLLKMRKNTAQNCFMKITAMHQVTAALAMLVNRLNTCTGPADYPEVIS